MMTCPLGNGEWMESLDEELDEFFADWKPEDDIFCWLDNDQ